MLQPHIIVIEGDIAHQNGMQAIRKPTTSSERILKTLQPVERQRSVYRTQIVSIRHNIFSKWTCTLEQLCARLGWMACVYYDVPSTRVVYTSMPEHQSCLSIWTWQSVSVHTWLIVNKYISDFGMPCHMGTTEPWSSSRNILIEPCDPHYSVRLSSDLQPLWCTSLHTKMPS